MRRFLLALTVSIIFVFNILVVNAESVSNKASINTSGLDSGVVGISYSSKVEKLKVLIEKNGKRYSYNLNNEGVEESFPLQMGNGEYKVSVLENVGGDKYRYIVSENVSLNLSDEKLVYLSSVQNVKWNEENAAIKKARELVKGLANNEDKLKVIYEYVVNNFKYDNDKLSKLSSNYLPDIDSTLAQGEGICYDYASVLAAMLRSEGIPSKLVKGYADKIDGYHAWNEVYNEKTNSWMVIDATYDSQMKNAKSKYSMVKQAEQYKKVYEY